MSWAPHAARLALESRAFPFLTYDPDGGDTIADCLSLEGNPGLDELWPSYDMEYVDDEGKEQRMTLPLTIADWAATEARFKKHFKTVPQESWNEDMVPFHEFIGLPADEAEGKTPFIWTKDEDQKLSRLSVTPEMVKLAHERLLYWNQLREMAGLEVSESVRDLVTGSLEADFDARLDAIRAEYEAKLAELRATYPRVVARKLAEGLLRYNGKKTVAELLDTAVNTPGLEPVHLDGGAATLMEAPATATAAVAAPAAPATHPHPRPPPPPLPPPLQWKKTRSWASRPT